ncbi:hypothetical protein [uncultured Erythrobacter sp.]|nr:hypothetical protein [uncultured Erythrobacter sp.]
MSGQFRRSNAEIIGVSQTPYKDGILRRHKHGPIRPMEEPSLMQRLFRRT